MKKVLLLIVLLTLFVSCHNDPLETDLSDGSLPSTETQIALTEKSELMTDNTESSKESSLETEVLTESETVAETETETKKEDDNKPTSNKNSYPSRRFCGNRYIACAKLDGTKRTSLMPKRSNSALISS